MELARLFGECLQSIRKRQGISQEELAHLCDLDRTYISLLERGKRQPSLTTIFVIAKNLGYKPSDLIKQIEN
ncbi:DNA-binding XRE family transcriptional regulator [Paenibacillus cellulosilyticus]|uniref:DNA-binding XRE family transcriptional regulator n=1 Tax=Paenibacillus cellulosilyticus TaxID=375489 RepID=A0A2V2YPW8_9BACL|nr:helix-turn-helix transcriptional regulator [Paenibacillus cellulosilyticus]PWV97404.1 DNA-binding XRE family transcriptional regulator [Paenibacillus cellulosilyticus]QKS48554.1 helix-turn-helix transcriptional regulator [Paenibacillus cellulosilyticus]